MATQKFSDNAITQLASSINSTDTIINVTPGNGDNFPAVAGASGTEYFVITMEDSNGNREFIRVNHRAAASDALGSVAYPCVRAYDGSTAKAWTAGDIVDLRWTSAGAERFRQDILDAVAVHDTPVDGATTNSISSNWAYDHNAATTGAHGISAFGASLIDDADAAAARATLGAVIGTDVQAYDADTAKYDDATANFTGTLQNGGSNVVVDSDIGVNVQAYDANTAKYDAVTANFTGTLQNGGSNVLVDTDIGTNVQAYDANIPTFPAGLTETELGYLDGVTSSIQTQLNNKAPTTVGQGQHTIWIPAKAMTPQETAGAALNALELATNAVNFETLDFDTASQEAVQFAIQMPKSWNEGSLVVQVSWSHPTTQTNFGVVWGIQASAFSDSDPLDAAWGTAVTATDTGGTANDIYLSPETAAMTVGGTPASEDYVVFKIYRDVNDASDNMAVDARLHGVKIHYTTNDDTDD